MSYSCNDNQNYFVGDGRTTSRVLQAPGGVTSICLGGYKKAKKTETNTAAAVTATADSEAVDKAKDEEEETKENQLSEEVTPDPLIVKGKETVSSNAFASSATTNSYNVLTDRPTSRVLAPPGGKTSISLG
uniref:Microtubule-associated protein Jupiter n=1 Tax=Odontella aurita TaxID=265563 RepID=A0A7S4HQG7_9STRA|mmetsp:Transcript_13616/g.39763  ORF Transcript_13616/g.39763 Transcript_13616/m.39763 type:complete len:131 (+) Transcript_13616:203-595(+)